MKLVNANVGHSTVGAGSSAAFSPLDPPDIRGANFVDADAWAYAEIFMKWA